MIGNELGGAMLDMEVIRWWAPHLRALDPLRRLSLAQIEPLYVERDRAPSNDIARDLLSFVADEHPERLPRKMLLCGARGSGKSTELARIAQLVHGAMHPLVIDLAQVLPREPTTLHLLTLLGLAGLAELRAWEQVPSETAAFGAALRGLLGDVAAEDVLGWIRVAGELLTQTGEPQSTAAGAVVAATAEATQKALPTLRALGARFADVSDATRLEQEDGRALATAVDTIYAQLHARTSLPPVLLVDGLDKAVDLSQVTAALAGIELLRDLRVALVLTGPVHLVSDMRLRAIAHDLDCPVLHNAPVVTPDGKDHAQGIDWLVKIYQKRRAFFNLPKDLIPDDAVRPAARASSGLVRDFLRILRDGGRSAERDGRRQVLKTDVEEGIRDLRQFLQQQLHEESVTVLDRVLRLGAPPSGEEASRLLYDNYIAVYPNGDLWYRPHEVLVEYVRRTAERMRG